MSWTDEELVARVLRGHRSARRAFVDRVGPVVRARVLRRTRGRGVGSDTTEDLIQRVFERIVRNDWHLLRKWDARRMSLVGYVSMIAGQAVGDAADHHGAQKRRPEGGYGELPAEVASGAVGPESRTAAREELLALWACLQASLGPSGRLVLTRLFVDRWDRNALAEALGWKRNRVDDWVRKIRQAADVCREGTR